MTLIKNILMWGGVGAVAESWLERLELKVELISWILELKTPRGIPPLKQKAVKRGGGGWCRSTDGLVAQWEERPRPRMAILVTICWFSWRGGSVVLAAAPWVFEGSWTLSSQWRHIQPIQPWTSLTLQPMTLILLHGPKAWAVMFIHHYLCLVLDRIPI